jgi:hypothetical protein
MGERINAYKFLVGESEGKKSLGVNTHKWEDNIKIDLK